MSRTFALIVLLVCGIAFSRELAPTVAVFTPVEHNVNLLELDILHKSLHMALAQSGYFTVLSLDETKNILEEQEEETTTKCLTNVCFYMTGRKLNIELALGSYISKKDDHYFLEVTLYDILNFETIASTTVSISSFSKANIVDLAKQATGLLLGHSSDEQVAIQITHIEENTTFATWGVAVATVAAGIGYFAYDMGALTSEDENKTILSAPIQKYTPGSLSGLRGFFASAAPGARYKAMGNTGVSTVNDGFAPAHNPAGLVHLTHSGITLSHSTLPSDIPQLYFSYSSMLTRNFFQGQALVIEGDDLAKEYQFLSSYATDLSLYSKYLTAVRAGVTLKGYLVTVGSSGSGVEKSTGYGIGYGVDFGLQWSLLNNFHFGAIIKDINSMIFYSNTLTDTDYSEDLPPLFTIGGHFESEYDLNLATSIQKSLYGDQKDHLSLGVEKQIFGLLWLRGGMSQILNQEQFRKWGLGFGLTHKQGRFTLKIDYSYDYGYKESDFFNKKQNVNFAVLF